MKLKAPKLERWKFETFKKKKKRFQSTSIWNFNIYSFINIQENKKQIFFYLPKNLLEK